MTHDHDAGDPPDSEEPVQLEGGASQRQLNEAEMHRVLRYQRENHVGFVEAAAQMGLSATDKSRGALSTLFQFPGQLPAPYAGPASLRVGADPFGTVSDAVNDLRRRLAKGIEAGSASNAMAVISPEAGDGRTQLAAELAASFALSGNSALLIEADFRAPTLAALLQLRSEDGLGGILAGDTVSDPVQEVHGIPGLHVITAGGTLDKPEHYLASPRLPILLQELQTKFDVVIIDVPAAASGPEFRLVSEAAGAAIVVCRAGTTRKRALDELIERLAHSEVGVAGLVLVHH